MPGHRVPLGGGWSLWRDVAVRRAGLPIEMVRSFAVPSALLADPAGRDATARAVTAEAFWSALADDLFMAALTWQNPAVVTSWAGLLARVAREGGRPEITRVNERERVVSRYVQRYTTKCESIGFFGPVAWASLGDADVSLRTRGSLGIRRRSVSFETWAFSELAAAWSKDPRLRRHLPVRLDPATSVDGRLLRTPRRAPAELDEIDLAILAELAGPGGGEPYRLGELIEVVTGRTGATGERIAGRIAELSAAGTLLIGFSVPFSGRPEEHLRAQVAELPAAEPRAELLAVLDELERDRDELAAVATDPEPLLSAMRRLQQRMEKAGGSSARRLARGGRGRTAVYLDCRSDLDIEIGRPLLDRLRAPLSILLDTGRWLCAEVGRTVESELRRQYRMLRRTREVVTLAELQLAAASVLVPGNPAVESVLTDFQLRWAEILPASGDGPVRLPADDVRALVRALFPEHRPGWATARQHSPDLLLCAEPDGRLTWVLGELHLAMNTLESRVFGSQADDRDRLVEATAADFPGGREVPVYPLNAVASNSRTYPPPALDPPGLHRYWSFGPDAGHELRVRSVPATAIRVIEDGGELLAEASGYRERVLEFFGEFLTALCVNLFQLRRPGPHAARVSIDDLVICRETWRFPAQAIPFPRSRPRDHTYAAVRAWAADAGIARHVFVQSPLQVKPVYVDFDAPALLDELARLVRAAAEAGADVRITEMLPGPGQLWLTCPDGRRYVSEFRMVTVFDADVTGVE